MVNLTNWDWLKPALKTNFGEPTFAATASGRIASISTSRGTVRENNEDRAAYFMCHGPAGAVSALVVCDGMGGLKGGGEAAEIALSSFIAKFISMPSTQIDARIREAVMDANFDVFEKFQGRGGTTIGIVAIDDASAVCCWVGDTRIYALRTIGESLRISKDDSLDEHLPSPSTTNDSPDRKRLIQYVGVGRDLEPNLGSVPKCDSVMIATDGAYSMTGELFPFFARHCLNLEKTSKAITQLADTIDGRDNATVGVITTSRRRERPTFPKFTVRSFAGSLSIVGPISPEGSTSTQSELVYRDLPKLLDKAKPRRSSKKQQKPKLQNVLLQSPKSPELGELTLEFADTEPSDVKTP